MNARRFVRLASLPATAIVVAAWLSPSPSPAAETCQFDAIGRLSDVSYDDDSSIHYTYDANGNLLSIVASISTTDVGKGSSETFPFTLGSSVPNPGSSARSIAFSTATAGHVTLRVSDVAGRAVASLYDRDLPPGRYVARFSCDRWAGGVYYYRLASAGRVLTGRMVVLR